MKLPRRKFLHLAATAAALPVLPRPASAQTYPSRPVRIVVGFAAGGAFDIVARTLGLWLSGRLGQQFVIENRTGAGSNTATEAVIRAPADGYTILLGGAVNAVNATLYDKLNFDFIRDSTPVAGVIRFSNLMQVNPALPVKTVPEFIAYAKANPGKINMGSGGTGTTQHLAGELFKMMTGITMVHVPYRGSALSLTDLIGGQVQVTFDSIPASIGHIRAGQLRALAVTAAMRSDVLPEIPTIGEFVPGYEASGWAGIVAPKGTPTDIVDKLNREINTGLTDPGLRARLADLGGTVLPGSPAEFGTLIADETEKWAKVVKYSGAKPG
jgi:tripartite-type tricarboxylate transporter receptor subunit TctC